MEKPEMVYYERPLDDEQMQVIILQDDRGITYKYYGAKFVDREPRIVKVFVGQVVHREELVEFLGGDLIEDHGPRDYPYN